jgi:hypothetical protein
MGCTIDDYPEDEIDEKHVTVLRAIDEHRRFSYVYDFGDSWKHEVVVEDFVTTPLGLKHAECVDGRWSLPRRRHDEHDGACSSCVPLPR